VSTYEATGVSLATADALVGRLKDSSDPFPAAEGRLVERHQVSALRIGRHQRLIQADVGSASAAFLGPVMPGVIH